MYECNLVEIEDFGFNHYIHHIDEYEDECFIFSEGHDCVVEIDEDIIWE